MFDEYINVEKKKFYQNKSPKIDLTNQFTKKKHLDKVLHDPFPPTTSNIPRTSLKAQTLSFSRESLKKGHSSHPSIFISIFRLFPRSYRPSALFFISDLPPFFSPAHMITTCSNFTHTQTAQMGNGMLHRKKCTYEFF